MVFRKFSQYLFFFSIGCSFLSVIIASIGNEAKSPKIAIFSSFTHKLLEDCGTSCAETLVSFANAPNTEFFNAQDSWFQAKKIARSLHKDPNVVAIVTLGPIATKVMSQIETKKPIVYAAVFDLDSLELPKTQTNLHGIGDHIDVNHCSGAIRSAAEQADSLVYLAPKESIPSSLRKAVIKKLIASGVNVSEMPISPTNIEACTHQIIEQHPAAVFLPFSSLPDPLYARLVSDILKEDIPLISNDSSLESEGVHMTCNVDFKQSGKQLAFVVYQLLLAEQGELPAC